jgi:hypothetical protein
MSGGIFILIFALLILNALSWSFAWMLWHRVTAAERRAYLIEMGLTP